MNKNLVFGYPYNSVRIIPMHDDIREKRVEGEDSLIVKYNFFEKDIKENKCYYYHGKMIILENSKPVLALFQYKNAIIAYGIVTEKIKSNNPNYIPPIDDEYPYDGLIKIDRVFTVENITKDELNDTLKQKINNFSQVLYNLDVKTDEFQALLFRKTNLIK